MREPSGCEEEWNPYTAPRSRPPATDDPPLPEADWGGLKVRVASVESTAWRRKIAVTGDVEAEILYDSAGPGERVYVDGRLAGTSSPFYWSFVAPRLEFRLTTGGFEVPAAIEAAAALSLRSFLRISRFRLIIAEKIVYDEPGKAAKPKPPGDDGWE